MMRVVASPKATTPLSPTTNATKALLNGPVPVELMITTSLFGRTVAW